MSFVAWSAIIGGGIVALVAVGAVMQFNGSAPAIISAALPGLVICLFGFLALVMVQIGRATLDSAEYGQQSLQVARDQLAFAKQVHLETNSGNTLNVGLSRGRQSPDAPSPNPIGAVASPPTTTQSLRHSARPQSILKDDRGNYRVGGQSFASLDAAQAFLETEKE